MATISQKEIRESLMEQLAAKGADINLYVDLINDYLFFCAQERKMQADVKRRGFTYTAVSAQGKEYEKENPCVKNAVIFNKQKLAILAQLGLKTDAVEPPDGDAFGL